MKLVERYLAKTILAAIGLITLLLVGLQFFILFVNQLGDLGKGDFHILNAITFVLLQLPYQIYLFFPVASLLGALVGLGVLANHSELVVMRAAGFSVGQITLSVIKASLIVLIFVTALGETGVPYLSRFGNQLKMQAISGGQAITTRQGVWMRINKNDFVTIGLVLPENILLNVYQFHFKENQELAYARKIDKLIYKDNKWQAYMMHETKIEKDKTFVFEYPERLWDLSINPIIFSLRSTQPDEMSLFALAKFLKAEVHEENTNVYELVFWQRLFQPLTTIVMMILAIPFIFGPLRSSTMGSKLVLGTSVGFGFYLMNRFLGPISQVYQWPPILAALVPTLIFACLGLYLMRRVR